MYVKGKFYLKSGNVLEDTTQGESVDKVRSIVLQKIKENYKDKLVFGDTIISISELEAVTISVK